MSQTELTPENSVEILRKYVDIGYKTGVLSIKDGAVLHKYFRVLMKQEKDESITEEDMYKSIFKVVAAFNTHKAYNLDDAAVIFTVVTYIEEKLLKKAGKIKEL